MNIVNIIKTFKRIFLYKISSTKRYSEILIKALFISPKNILEIGVYTGRRSIEIMDAATIFKNQISYYGFDLFEDISDNKIKDELSKKPESQKILYKKLKKKHRQIKLVKGDTLKTLKKIKIKKKFDLIFIDGGHSVKTIESDWSNCIKFLSKNGIIILDDYYTGNKKVIKKFGCNKLINKIKNNYSVTYSNHTDYFPDKNYGIKLVYVKNLNFR